MTHTESLNLRKIHIIYIASFFFQFALALIAYTQSTFLEEIVPKRFVGLVFVGAYIITFFVLTNFEHIIARFGKFLAAIGVFLLSILALVVLWSGGPPIVMLGAFTLYIVGTILVWVSFDFLLETYSADTVTGSIRGAALTVVNVGWVVAPTLAGIILTRFDFSGLFVAGALLMVGALVIVMFAFHAMPDHDVTHARPFFSTLRSIMGHRPLRHIFSIAFLLQFFYAWMVIYTPIHLLSLGLTWETIGWIFSIMLLPFVLIQYPAGVVADRWLGEKEMLIAGFCIMSVATAALFFLTTPVVWLWALLLFSTRIGASLVEVMRDTYFFKQIDRRDINLIDLFRDTYPLAYIIAPIVATAFLLFFPMRALFLILGLFMLSGVVVSVFLKDTK